MSEKFFYQPSLNGTEPIGEYLSFEAPQGDWAADGYCAGFDAGMFDVTVPGSPDPFRIAETLCAECPVKAECLADDILMGVTKRTVRGGVIRSERERMAVAYYENKRYIPSSRTQGQYRDSGFSKYMGAWREGLVSEIQDKEAVVFSIEKQIEAGTVLSDTYYEELSAKLQGLRQQLSFIKTEEHKW